MLKKTSFAIGLQDIREALGGLSLPFMLAWQDISIRYKRSRVGQFWLTLNTLIYISSLGVIFGTLFRLDLHEYLPNICAAVLTWNFISACLSEGSLAFISSENIILQVKIPFSSHIFRIIFRNMIVFFHNILIFPVVAIFVGYKLNFLIFLSMLGLAFVVVNLAWIAIILAVFCTRFRDLHQVIVSFLQIMFYATPVVWNAKVLPPNISPLFLKLNPFCNFIYIVKQPLLGFLPEVNELIFCGGMTVVGWVLAIYILGRYKHRIAYWL